MNADGSNQRQLTFNSQPKDQVPDWSPNGSKIAYLARAHRGIADIGKTSWGDIWVMNADGSTTNAVTHDATDYGTAWSPDGTRIATLDFPTPHHLHPQRQEDRKRPAGSPPRRPPVRPRLAAPRHRPRRRGRRLDNSIAASARGAAGGRPSRGEEQEMNRIISLTIAAVALTSWLAA